MDDSETRPPRSGLGRALLPWLTAGLVDAGLTLGGYPRPRWWQYLFEIGLLALAGRSQWRLARGWLRTPLLAPAVMIFYASTLWAPSALHQRVPFLIGIVALLAWLLRVGGTRLAVSPVVGAALAALVVVGARYTDRVAELHQSPIVSTRALLASIAWPFPRTSLAGSAPDRPPVVVITVDTLRTDAAGEMQTMRRLAVRGATWTRAMSTSSWTLPALGTLQTGRMPHEHGASCLMGGHCQGIFPGVRLLAEDLKAVGYATAAVISNPWITAGTGFDRGFDRFMEVGSKLNRLLVGGEPAGPQRQDARWVVDAALAWLESAPDTGFYLWVHLLDPHLPYFHADQPSLHTLTENALRNSMPLLDDRKNALRAAYAEEVAYADRHLVRLLDELERRGILSRGVVVFTSDHGEEFWEHGGMGHGHSHHGEVVDVPLVVVAPGLPPGPRTGVASLLDVAPTIRAAVGLVPNGIDLRGSVPEGRIATAWGGLVAHIDCSARSPDRRVIVRDCAEAPSAISAFDLDDDPRELQPSTWEPSEPVVRAARAVSSPPRDAPATVDREALRALGYVE